MFIMVSAIRGVDSGPSKGRAVYHSATAETDHRLGTALEWVSSGRVRETAAGCGCAGPRVSQGGLLPLSVTAFELVVALTFRSHIDLCLTDAGFPGDLICAQPGSAELVDLALADRRRHSQQIVMKMRRRRSQSVASVWIKISPAIRSEAAFSVGASHCAVAGTHRVDRPLLALAVPNSVIRIFTGTGGRLGAYSPPHSTHRRRSDQH